MSYASRRSHHAATVVDLRQNLSLSKPFSPGVTVSVEMFTRYELGCRASAEATGQQLRWCINMGDGPGMAT